MPWKGPLVLGLELNRSERAGTRGAAAPRPQIAYRQKFLNLFGASSV